eukprot:SAG11_NODE_4867_length_1740_cov_15.989031_1_plen_380_part_00
MILDAADPGLPDLDRDIRTQCGKLEQQLRAQIRGDDLYDVELTECPEDSDSDGESVLSPDEIFDRRWQRSVFFGGLVLLVCRHKSELAEAQRVAAFSASLAAETDDEERRILIAHETARRPWKKRDVRIPAKYVLSASDLAFANIMFADEDDPEYVIVLPRCRACQRAWPVPGFCTTCIEQGAGPEQHWTAPLEAAMMHRLAATPMPAVAERASEPDDDSEAAPRDERYDRWATALASDDSSSDEDDSSTGLSLESGAETPAANAQGAGATDMPETQSAAQTPRQRVSLPELFAAAAIATVRPAAVVLAKLCVKAMRIGEQREHENAQEAGLSSLPRIQTENTELPPYSPGYALKNIRPRKKKTVSGYLGTFIRAQTTF